MLRRRLLNLTPSVLFCVLLSGCSSKSFHSPANVELTGRVMGGEQPITDSTVQLYAVSSTGTGASSTKLISATVTTSDGTITTVAGNGVAGYVASQDGGAATSAEHSDPSGVAVGSSGNLYLADSNNDRVRVVYH